MIFRFDFDIKIAGKTDFEDLHDKKKPVKTDRLHNALESKYKLY